MITAKEMSEDAENDSKLRERLESLLKALPKENLELIAIDAMHYLISIEHAQIAENGSITCKYCGDEIGDI